MLGCCAQQMPQLNITESWEDWERVVVKACPGWEHARKAAVFTLTRCSRYLLGTLARFRV
jgi:hypothetical protein